MLNIYTPRVKLKMIFKLGKQKITNVKHAVLVKPNSIVPKIEKSFVMNVLVNYIVAKERVNISENQ